MSAKRAASCINRIICSTNSTTGRSDTSGSHRNEDDSSLLTSTNVCWLHSKLWSFTGISDQYFWMMLMKCWKASCSQLLQCLITQEILSTALKAWPAGNCVYVTLRIKWITCKCVFQKAAHRTGFRDLFDVTERSLPLSGQCFLTFLHYNSLSSVYHLQTFCLDFCDDLNIVL